MKKHIAKELNKVAGLMAADYAEPSIAQQLVRMARSLVALKKGERYRSTEELKFKEHGKFHNKLRKNLLLTFIGKGRTGDQVILEHSKSALVKHDLYDPWSWEHKAVGKRVFMSVKDFGDFIRSGRLVKVPRTMRDWTTADWKEYLKHNGKRLTRLFLAGMKEKVSIHQELATMSLSVVTRDGELYNRGDDLSVMTREFKVEPERLVPDMDADMAKWTYYKVAASVANYLRPYNITTDIKVHGKTYKAKWRVDVKFLGGTKWSMTHTLLNEKEIVSQIPDKGDLNEQQERLIESVNKVSNSDVSGSLTEMLEGLDIEVDIGETDISWGADSEDVWLDSITPESTKVTIDWDYVISAIGVEDEIEELDATGADFVFEDIMDGLYGQSGVVDDVPLEVDASYDSGGTLERQVDWEVVDLTKNGVIMEFKPDWDGILDVLFERVER